MVDFMTELLEGAGRYQHERRQYRNRNLYRVKLPLGELLHVTVKPELASLINTISNFRGQGLHEPIPAVLNAQHTNFSSLISHLIKSVTMGFADFQSDAGLTSKASKQREKRFR